jgi:hypothetical protein
MTITETLLKHESVIKESPLGFYYKSFEEVPYQKEQKVGVKVITHHIFVTLYNTTYHISYLVKCGDTKIGFDSRPWDICIGDMSMREHFIKALQKILDGIFTSAGHIKECARTKEKVYTELFGNPKGYTTVSNDIKIVSHGFDLKESFRSKQKRIKVLKKSKKNAAQ